MARQHSGEREGRPIAVAALLVCLAAAPTAAERIFVLAAIGSCVEETTLAFAGASPDTAVEIYMGTARGAGTVPSAPCDGTALEIAEPELAATLTADGDGGSPLDGDPVAEGCDLLLQAVDLGTCSVSNLVRQGRGDPAPVPRTGQPDCWDSSGEPTSCDATGQDGELRRGVAWPEPRFVDHGDGTVTDELTGLRWLKDANCFLAVHWDEALAAADGLADGACGLADGSVPGDWRLPNLEEMQSLIDYGEVAPAIQVGHPFEDVVSGPPGAAHYWTSTTREAIPDEAWYVTARNGHLKTAKKTGAGQKFVWPVRGGQ